VGDDGRSSMKLNGLKTWRFPYVGLDDVAVSRIHNRSSCPRTRHEGWRGVDGSGGVAALILASTLKGRWVVSFTHYPLYPQDERPRHPLIPRLGGPQHLCGHFRREKIICRNTCTLIGVLKCPFSGRRFFKISTLSWSDESLGMSCVFYFYLLHASE
jgi:hypothetical protein